MTARDQHQPASSRAMATLAMTGPLPAFVERQPAGVQAGVALLAARARARHGAWSQRVAHRLAGGSVGARWCQAASTSSRRAWVLPVLVIDPCERDAPEEDSVGTRPRNAPIVDPVNRCQSPISTARPNAVRVEIPRRQPSRPHHGGELGVGGHRLDRRVEPVTPGDDVRDGLVVGLERHLPRRVVEPLPAQPRVMLAGPCIPAGPDDALAKQQLAQPVPGTHQIAAGVLPGADQVPGSLLVQRGDRHRR